MWSRLLLILLACALSCSAFEVQISQSKRINGLRRRTVVRPHVLAVSNDDGSDNMGLTTANDLIYIANITVGGSEYPVQLDTGSSDLWLKGPTFPLPNVNHSDTQLNLTYGIGWSFGNISTANVEFAGLTIPAQALVDASSAQNPALQYSADGILGLGFTSLSTIDSVINKTGSSWGRSLLYNAFLTNPKEPNYITFALQRSNDPSDDVIGTFTIGEVKANYSSIQTSPQISTWPVVSPNRWNVLLQSFIVGTQTFGVSSNVTGVPSGNAVVLLDSGTSYTYCPVEVAQAIYGGVSGASYDADAGLWSVPCDAEIDMALQFGNEAFPIHPLDVVPTSASNKQTCVGSFVPQAMSIGGGEFDWLMGDNVLRSLYSLYDFGDFDSKGNMGNPYIKLLSIVDPNEASKDFTSIRGGTPRTNITYNATPSSGSTGTLSLTDTTADKLAKLVDYIPAVLGILALNGLALIVISIVAVIYMCRKSRLRRSGAKRRSTNGMHLGMSLNGRTPTPYPGAPVSPRATESHTDLVNTSGTTIHEYEEVSTTVPGEPEDQPFVPPAPAFRGYDGDTLRPINPNLPSPTRPRSMFSVTSGGSQAMGMPRDYRVSTAGSDMTAFVPPSPKFVKDGNERPKSFA